MKVFSVNKTVKMTYHLYLFESRKILQKIWFSSEQLAEASYFFQKEKYKIIKLWFNLLLH